MQRKRAKWLSFPLFFALILSVTAVPVARATMDNTQVVAGTTLNYSVSGTSAFVSWDFPISILVTYVNDTYAFGNVSSNNGILQSGENVSLSIFVIRNVMDWHNRPNIHNVTTSQMLEAWDANHLTINSSGIYNDVTRDTVVINFTINATVDGQDAQENFQIAWDHITGVLVEFHLHQTHPEPEYTGTWDVVLSTTNLWALAGPSIAGYPAFMLAIMSLAGIMSGIFLTKKRWRHAGT
ncbi:MAG TPA: hypothetical protein VKK79_03110 [Candidatus Lokiarchaeia archaeon]|nr:hypothetical protein [Candidatus Lokiarchaeia archaeon]